VRRVVIKAELLKKGSNARFVVTNRTAEPERLYDGYVDRGEAEGYIKDLKHACRADRLSCHGCWANQFRLLLHGAAYWLLDTLRRWLVQLGRPSLQLDTLRLIAIFGAAAFMLGFYLGIEHQLPPAPLGTNVIGGILALGLMSFAIEWWQGRNVRRALVTVVGLGLVSFCCAAGFFWFIKYSAEHYLAR
jgi:hypothetical protein